MVCPKFLLFLTLLLVLFVEKITNRRRMMDANMRKTDKYTEENVITLVFVNIILSMAEIID